MVFGRSASDNLLVRSDSKNPATTCKGITTKGLPCRRDLSAATTSFYGRHHNIEGVIAILDAGHAAAFFCHDHRHQANELVADLRSRAEVVKVKKKSSIDTLVERFGVLDVDEEQTTSISTDHGGLHSQAQRPARRKIELPQKWQDIQGPLMVVPEEIVTKEHLPRKRPGQPQHRRPKPPHRDIRRSNVKASWSCCIQVDDGDDDPLPSRRSGQDQRKPPLQSQRSIPTEAAGQIRQSPQQAISEHRKPVSSHDPQLRNSNRSGGQAVQNQAGRTSIAPPTRPQLQPRYSSSSPPNSQTMALLSNIPPHLSPEITSNLFAELSKPISEADAEGYIYIYWLTPESDDSKPDDETASSLLDGDDYQADLFVTQRYRRSSDSSRESVSNKRLSAALQRYASVKLTPQEPRKILLKIGRSSNVHRRLTEWTKQCGQNITLIRSYPHHSGGSTSSSLYPQLDGGRKTVSHVHRVERLIHLELTEKRVINKRECNSCGRAHREWFEVDASKQAVREIDEVIRRWINWADIH